MLTPSQRIGAQDEPAAARSALRLYLRLYLPISYSKAHPVTAPREGGSAGVFGSAGSEGRLAAEPLAGVIGE